MTARIDRILDVYGGSRGDCHEELAAKTMHAKASFAGASQRRGNLAVASDNRWTVGEANQETRKRNQENPRLEPLSPSLGRLVFLCFEGSNVRQ